MQLETKEISDGLHKLELHDESEAFLEVGENPFLALASSCQVLERVW